MKCIFYTASEKNICVIFTQQKREGYPSLFDYSPIRKKYQSFFLILYFFWNFSIRPVVVTCLFDFV